MKKEDVPQDFGPEAALRRIMWAQDDQGHFVGVQSVGWDVSNTSFYKYWEYMGRILNEARDRVQRGECSPLYYWMRVNVLNERMLAGYMGTWSWRVRRHMRPRVFSRLKPEVLARYAKFMQISVEQLQSLPDKDPEDLPIPRPGQV